MGIKLADDSRQAFVTLGRANHVAFVNTKTHAVEDHVLVGDRAWGIAQSRDGKQLYVTNGLSDDMSIVDIDQRKTLRSIAAGRVPHSVVIDTRAE